jgi:hypothetical protein
LRLFLLVAGLPAIPLSETMSYMPVLATVDDVLMVAPPV